MYFFRKESIEEESSDVFCFADFLLEDASDFFWRKDPFLF
ncbi:hypothetical protein LEP1GSC133_2911 [Leptospira borgpetersenii serovar Pomona str. 200901868]|uniref:Uncharacterized protein n=1 Tax=Leptospira borgpetersenii serovar Pomona str. 200901868 TaxID=1192866 RepID=M6W4W8_LEPBO|nr:hypothetical protein LEP1GSC133_2911 [Leptospira borgpetersenii serovar Pomona str. 200901868]